MNSKKIWQSKLPLLLKKFYNQMGAQFPKTPNHATLDLIDWTIRVPKNTPRELYTSKELQRKLLTAAEHNALLDIQGKAIRGEDLTIYLGETTLKVRNRNIPKAQEKSKKPPKEDGMFQDWGLLHFHLSVDLSASREQVARSRRVLIAKLTSDKIYLIDVIEHGKGFGETWGNSSFLEIMENNWPDLPCMSNHRVFEPLDSSSTPTAKEIIDCRKVGLNIPVQLSGGSIFFGEGITIDGCSIQASRICQQLNTEFEIAEEKFRVEFGFTKPKLVVDKNYSVGFFCAKENKFVSYLHKGSIISNLLEKLTTATKICPGSDKYFLFKV
jgi:hypothetical protein